MNHSFDAEKAEMLISDYSENNQRGFHKLYNYLSILSIGLEDNITLVKDEDFMKFVFEVIGFTDPSFERSEDILSKCLDIAKKCKEKGGFSALYNQCLINCVNNSGGNIGFLWKEIINYSLEENVYLEAITALVKEIKKRKKKDGFDLLYNCCNFIATSKSIEEKQKILIGSSLLNAVEKSEYTLPLFCSWKKISELHKLEIKWNKGVLNS